MRWIFTLLLSSLFITTFGQNVPISGSIHDYHDHAPLYGATVAFQSKTDSAIQFFTITDSAGVFHLRAAPGRYSLAVTTIGYLSFDSLLTVTENAPLIIEDIFLMKDAGLLDEVTVRATPPAVKQKDDTLEYNSAAFRVNPDASAEDLVRKMPGITVSQGKVQAGGEDVKKVTVDGREFFGEDATAALKNLPAEIIDKIQVFDRLSEEAQLTGVEDDNTAKGINIVTKPNMRNGQFGRLFAGYGTDGRYSAGGNVSIFDGTRRISLVGMTNNVNLQNFATEDLLGVISSGGQRGGGRRGGRGGGRGFGNSGNFLVGQQSGISKTNSFGINFSDQWSRKLEVTGSYFFNNSNNSADELVNREYFIDADSSQFYNEKSTSHSENYNHRFNMRLEYKIDSANTLIFTPNISFQKNEAQSGVTGENFTKGKNITSQSGNSNLNNQSGYNINNNILFRHAFGKRGRSLTVNLGTSFNNRDGETFLEAVNRSFETNGGLDDSLRQMSNKQQDGYQLSASVTYTEPVGKKGMLRFNYRPSYSVNHSDRDAYQYDFFNGKYSLFDTSLSNQFDNTYTRHNGGVSYRYRNKGNSFSIGVNYQQADLHSDQEFPYRATVDRTFWNVLPSAMWNSKLSPKSSIRLSYRSNTSAPSINQLQDVINNNNPLRLSTGNPNLDQQFSHNMIFRYTYTNSAKGISLLSNLFFQKTDNYVGNATYLASADSVLSSTVTLYKGAQLIKPINLDGYWNVRSFVTLGMPLKFIKSTLNWNAGYSYGKVPGLINNVSNVSENQTYNAGAVLASNISENVDFTVSYMANFNRVKNSIQPELNNNYFSQMAGVRLNLLSNNGWLFQNDLNNQSYRGLTDGYNQSFWLWNIGVGKKFLKKNRGELKLTVFDLLKQNQSISRNVEETYIEDVQTQVLQQYFMLTFTYNLRNFGKR